MTVCAVLCYLFIYLFIHLCTVLYCTVLYCAVLCCAVLCCAVLCCAVPSKNHPVPPWQAENLKIDPEERNILSIPVNITLISPTAHYKFNSCLKLSVHWPVSRRANKTTN